MTSEEDEVWRAVMENNPDIPPDQRKQLKSVIRKFHGIFSLSPADLGCTEVVEHPLMLKTNHPSSNNLDEFHSP